MGKKCEFGEIENSLLKIRIVLGVNNLKLQDRLLRTPDLSIDKIVEYLHK